MITHSSLFPAIGGSSLGKATNHLIKNLLNNFDNENYNSNKRLPNNYHSLPPIVPPNKDKEQFESKIPRPKYILHPSEIDKNRINF